MGFFLCSIFFVVQYRLSALKLVLTECSEMVLQFGIVGLIGHLQQQVAVDVEVAERP